METKAAMPEQSRAFTKDSSNRKGSEMKALVMKAAWAMYRKESEKTMKVFSDCLKRAWFFARHKIAFGKEMLESIISGHKKESLLDRIGKGIDQVKNTLANVWPVKKEMKISQKRVALTLN